MTAESGPGRGRRLFFNVNLIFFTQVVNYGLLFLLNVMLARGLGPEGRGDYALFILAVTFLASIATLGTGLGSIYYLGKGRHEVPDLLGNSHLLALGSGALAVVALLGVTIAHGSGAFFGGRAIWLLLPALPLTLEFLLLSQILIGREDFVGYNTAALVQTVALLAGTALLALTAGLTTTSVLAVWSGSYGAGTAAALAFIATRHVQGPLTGRLNLTVLREQVRLGLPGQAGNVLQFLNYRLDQFMVKLFRSTPDVGLYAVAVGLSESVWWIANAVSMALIPRLTRMQAAEAGQATPVACRSTLLVSLVAATGLAISAPVAVRVLFGSDYVDSAMPIVWLTPGITLLAGAKVLSSYVFSQGKMVINSIIALAAVGTTVLFDLLLIPSFGITGAAAASSLTYAATFALYLYVYRRLSGCSPWTCVVPQSADLQLYRGLVHDLVQRAPLAPAFLKQRAETRRDP